MYSYLKGIVTEKFEDFVVLENNGIGYEIAMSQNSLFEIELNKEIILYTRLIVKEDEMSLCGFTSKEERSLFDNLLTVSGVGKKSALSAISNAGVDQIIKWIITEDYKSLVKLNGVGKKTAERLVVELRDKFKKLYQNLQLDAEDSVNIVQNNELEDDIILALSGLGFSTSEIKKMCSGMPAGLGVEGAIKYALKKRNE